MFAFGIYDDRKRKLILGRDICGEKPLFYFLKNNTIYFASELKALLANKDLPRKINHESLDYYLSFGFIPGSKCILEGYKKLPPGWILDFNLDSGKTNLEQYWSLPSFCQPKEGLNELEILENLKSLLSESVSQCLEADVNTGILLSGGLDSSLITAIAGSMNKKIYTYSVAFPSNSNLDESYYSKLISDHFSTEHTQINFKNFSFDDLDKFCNFIDEPIMDSSIFASYLIHKEIKKYCKVVIGGDGGDELFGGYSHYQRILKLNRLAGFIPLKLKNIVSNFSENFLSMGIKGRNYLSSLKYEFNYDQYPVFNKFDSNSKKLLLNQIPKINFHRSLINEELVNYQYDPIQFLTRMDFYNFLPEDILVKGDRTSMMNSVELRSPFLSKKLVEFAFSRVPSEFKTTTSMKKIILQKLGKQILPKEFVTNRKQGFNIPIKECLNSPNNKILIKDALFNNNSNFNKDFCMDLLKKNKLGLNNSEQILGLILLEKWRENFSIEL